MHVLLIEDSDSDALLIRRMLTRADAALDITRASGLQEALDCFAKSRPDIVLLDLALLDSNSNETFSTAHASFADVPIIVLTGSSDHATVGTSVANGAQDCLPKDTLSADSLARSIRYALERNRITIALRELEQRHTQLFANFAIPCLIYDAVAPHPIREVNQAAVRLYGWSAEQFVRMTVLDIRPADEVDSLLALLSRIGDERMVISGTHRKKCGELFRADVLSYPVKIAGTRMRMAMITDLSELEGMREVLARKDHVASTTTNTFGAPIIILDESGNVIEANDSWKCFASDGGIKWDASQPLSYLETINRATWHVSHGAEAMALGLRKIFDGVSETFCCEFACSTPVGTTWWRLRATRAPGSSPIRVVVVHEDLSHSKRTEDLEIERKSLRAAIKAMNDVLGMVGHELRTPLASLQIMGEFLLACSDRNSADFEKFLKRIAGETLRMSDTVDNLLEAARLNSGHARWNWEEYDVEPVLQEAMQTVAPFAANGQRLSHRIPIKTIVRGDSGALRRLAINLLSNAIKHTKAGEIDLVARVERRIGKHWLVIGVTDTGDGIAPAVLERLGEAFVLNSGSIGASHISGAGLGMAICKGIVAAHGGTLSIESILGRGTTIVATVRADLQSPQEIHASTDMPAPQAME